MKAVLLRVGIDRGYGFLSPVFSDLSYKYIPIYYKNKVELEVNEKRSYYELSLCNRNKLVDYVPDKYKSKIIHYDPEFDSYSYGEMTNPKRGALLKLNKGDLLIFYLGGEYHIDDNITEMGCFIFGYFEVERVYEWNKSENERNLMIKECKNNAHIISSKSKDNLVIVKGTKRSRQLDKCVYFTEINQQVSNPPYITKDIFTNKYGIRKNVVRATPQTITEETFIINIKELLNIKF